MPTDRAKKVTTLIAQWHLLKRAYTMGHAAPHFPVPAVWIHPDFRVDFHFYVIRGEINAMMDEQIARYSDEISINRRQ